MDTVKVQFIFEFKLNLLPLQKNNLYLKSFEEVFNFSWTRSLNLDPACYYFLLIIKRSFKSLSSLFLGLGNVMHI